MFNRLIKLLNNANAKFTNFRVSSIIKDNKGNEYEGVNLEFAIPANSICAERNAITSAITQGMDINGLKEVHILGGKYKNTDKEAFTPPCGVCRQLILEISNSNAEIFLYNFKGEVKQYSINELLPVSFSGEEI